MTNVYFQNTYVCPISKATIPQLIMVHANLTIVHFPPDHHSILLPLATGQFLLNPSSSRYLDADHPAIDHYPSHN